MHQSSTSSSTPTKQNKGDVGKGVEGNRMKILPEFSHLKSSIPRPVPYIRVTRERSRSCSTHFYKGSTSSVCTSTTHKRSLSQSYPASEPQQLRNNTSQSDHRPESLSAIKCIIRNQYSNVKAKIDNKTPASLLAKSQGIRSKDSLKSNNTFDIRSKGSSGYDIEEKDKEDSHVDVRGKDSFNSDHRIRNLIEEPPGEKIFEKYSLSDELAQKENISLTTYSGSSSWLSLSLHTLEGGLTILKTPDIFGNIEGTKCYFLKQCAPEFLASFANRMEEVTELWLQLICDLIETKMTICKSALPQFSLHSPRRSLKNQITKFFKNLPTQGEILYEKLCKIEDDQLNILQVIVRNIVALVKEHDALKTRHALLGETLENTQTQLKAELAILSEENKVLHEKCTAVNEQYEDQKLMMEQMVEYHMESLMKVQELKQVVEQVEKQCIELEKRGERVSNNQQKLEKSIKSLEVSHEKEHRKYADLSKKQADSDNMIQKLKQVIKESKDIKLSLDEKVKSLQEEISVLKTELENSKQKRTELEKEVSVKNMKIRELESEMITTLKEEYSENKKPLSDENNLEQISVLVSIVDKRNKQIAELKKRINRLENMLRDKSNREETLVSQAAKLNRKFTTGCISLNNQVRDLQSSVKGLQNQISELEKVLGQKTLELDQRDRLIKELMELIKINNGPESRIWLGRKSGAEILAESESIYRQRKMAEVFSLMERKQMDLMKLENRLRSLKKLEENTDNESRSGEK